MEKTLKLPSFLFIISMFYGLLFSSLASALTVQQEEALIKKIENRLNTQAGSAFPTNRNNINTMLLDDLYHYIIEGEVEITINLINRLILISNCPILAAQLFNIALRYNIADTDTYNNYTLVIEGAFSNNFDNILSTLALSCPDLDRLPEATICPSGNTYSNSILHLSSSSSSSSSSSASSTSGSSVGSQASFSSSISSIENIFPSFATSSSTAILDAFNGSKKI